MSTDKCKPQRKYLGFSLLELMIVMIIVAILSSIGIPAYQEYSKRTKLMLALQAAKPAQTKLQSVYAKSGSLLKVKDLNLSNSGATAVTVHDFLIPTTEIVYDISVVDGNIILILDKSKLSLEEDPEINFTLQSSGNWTCQASSTIYEYISCDLIKDPPGKTPAPR